MPTGRRPLLVALLGAAVAAGVGAQPAPPATPAAFADAARAIVRLDPPAFPGLPTSVAAALDARGCRIPQPAHTAEPANVITGHFFDDPRPLDWAVLCSVGGRSFILVIPGQVGELLLPPDGRTIVELHARPDEEFLQVVAPGAVGYARVIATAPAGRIAAAAAAHAADLPPLMHDGIEDAFGEKASIIWYRYAGRWLQLPGAD